MKTRKLHIICLQDKIVSASTDYVKILNEFKELHKNNPLYWMQTIYQ